MQTAAASQTRLSNYWRPFASRAAHAASDVSEAERIERVLRNRRSSQRAIASAKRAGSIEWKET